VPVRSFFEDLAIGLTVAIGLGIGIATGLIVGVYVIAHL
jgi:hypothetical protein